MRKRAKPSEGGASWMDTYGDLVTLLLCFFVLLYSISTVDQAKWKEVVKSFNPDAKEPSQIALNPEENATEDVPGGFEDGTDTEVFDELYKKLKQAMEESNLTSEVELYQGDGYTFITFRDNVFFDGDSSVIREEGKVVLTKLGEVIYSVKDSVSEIQVYGHTTQALPDTPNDVESDRVLSSERSARVVAYLQNICGVPPDRLVSLGYGQFRPISPFDTEENRSKNRRVEMLITKSDSVVKSLDDFYKTQQMGVNAQDVTGDTLKNSSENKETNTEDTKQEDKKDTKKEETKDTKDTKDKNKKDK